MTEMFNYARAHPNAAPATTKPAACQGVPDATLQKLVGQIASSALSSALSTAFPVPVATDTPTDNPASPTSTPVAAPDPGLTAADVASQLGATDVQAQPMAPGWGRSIGSACGLEGQNVTVNTFATEALLVPAPGWRHT